MARIRTVVCAITGTAAVIAAIAVSTGADPGSTFQGNNREQVLRTYARLPLAFVENRGQTDPRVRYFGLRQGAAFFLTPDEIVLRMTKLPSGSAVMMPAASREAATQGIALGLKFLNSNSEVVLAGEERLAGETNFIRGDDPQRWQAGLSSFASVVYRDLWPGIDLRLRGESGTFKYEFRLRPGARLADIRLAYTGVDGLSLDPDGSLRVHTPLGVLRDSPPVTYQQISGVRVPVESRYALADQSYGFAAGNYDARYELIIDPGLDYSTYLGGASHELGAGIAVDASGNAYVVGITQSPDFPTRPGSFDRTGAASNSLDAFVSKINATGTALIYSTFIGGTNFEWGRGIAIDGAGNAYITGQTQSSNFPTTGGAFDRTFNVDTCPRCGIDQYDAFVLKLNAAGSALVYSTFLGGFDIDDGMAIAIDSSGNAYVAGETGSLNFPTTAGAFDTSRNGAFDAFVTKFNATGSALIYSTFLGGAEVDFPARIAVSKDGANNVLILGSTRSPDFPTTPGAFDNTANGEFDVFVTRLNPSGSQLVYSTLLGGSAMDSAGGLATDAAGNTFISGGTVSPDFPTTAGAFDRVLNDSDAFVAKLNAAGTTLVYSTFLGGSAGEGAATLALDSNGNVYVSGGTGSLDFPITAGAAQPQYAGGPSDAFVTKLNANGSVVYSTYLGGASSEGGWDVAIDAAGSVYVTGQTLSTNFPTTPGAIDSVFNGNPDIFWADAFVTKLTPQGGPPPSPALSSVTTNPSAVVGGAGSTGTVALTLAAVSPGATVTLSSSNTNAVTVPASVTIQEGASSANFAISTSAVAANTSVTITAAYDGVTKPATLTVTPQPPAASLQTLSVSPASVTAGAGSQGTVTLTGSAPSSGFAIALSSSHAAAAVPASVTVPQGSSSATFPITTSSVTSSTAVTIIATAGSVTRTATLTVTPAAQNRTLTVTATGRSGERVTSTPTGINVAVGTTGSAQFAGGTSITLRVTNSRDAVWSSPCTSGSQKTKTCTLTLNANTAVTANVQ